MAETVIKLKEVERTKLKFCDGFSDKIYIAIIYKDEDGGYRVLFKYGKRCKVSNLNEKYFHTSVPYGEALCFYQEMIDKKLKKGYTRCD